VTPGVSSVDLQPFFLQGSAGRIFCVYYGPAGAAAPAAGILYAPPFAEEMNKSRRQAALQARALAAAGYGVLVPDLFGTGDSDGELGDARWDIWLDDLGRAADWLQRKAAGRLSLWGLRLGCMLAVDALDMLPHEVDRLLLWQPAVSGTLHMKQFFRLRVAADMIAGADQGSTQAIADELESGQTVEIAGYELHPDLVAAISACDLGRFDGAMLPPVDWFEVVAAEGRQLPMPSRRVIDGWKKVGTTVGVDTVVGEPFWSTTEIAVIPELVTRTCAAAQASSA